MFRRRLPLLLLAALCLMISPAFGVSAQESSVPVPYEEDEFPLWAHDLRRFTVVMAGSFPFTMLYTSAGYSVIRWGINGFSEPYAPSFGRSGADIVPMTTDEKLGVVLSAVGFSAVVAIIDLIIVQVKRDRGEVEDSLAGSSSDGG